MPAVMEFVDIAGLVKGASEGGRAGNKFCLTSESGRHRAGGAGF